MSSAFVGTAICYFTVATELAFPFAVLSARPWIRKGNTLAIEAMHLGIMAFMGLVCFGLLMIGADCACLRDEDYRAMYRKVLDLRERLTGWWWSRAVTAARLPKAAPVPSAARVADVAAPAAGGPSPALIAPLVVKEQHAGA
jgi:hypothetical protein